MRVTVLELPARWGAVDSGLDAVEAQLQHEPGDVVLLPEASLTGYLPDPSTLAEGIGGPTAKRCAELASRYGTVLVAPLVEKDEGRCFNAVTAYGPQGRLFHYRKRHPWYVESWATAGENEYPLVSVGGRALSAAICFDVHFLAEAEETLERVDVLLFASAWVDESEEDARATLLPALARRFDCAVVNANWGVGKPRVRGQGGSMVVERDGAVVARTNRKTKRLDVTLR